MLSKKMTLIGFLIAICMVSPSFAGQNFVGNVFVDRITHYGNHIRIGIRGHGQNDWFFNDGTPYNLQSVPPDSTGTMATSSQADWCFAISTTNPYYKEFLAILITAYKEDIPVDIEWYTNYGTRIDTNYWLTTLTSVGLVDKY